MRYTAEHKSATRQRLVSLAADAIRAEGPHQVGVASVMAKAGLTHGGFYAHFESKDALVAEAVAEMFRQSAVRLNRVREKQPLTDGLREYIRFYLSPRHRDAIEHGCPVPALLSDAPRQSEPVREAFAHGAQSLKRQLAGVLADLGHPRGQADAAADSLLAEMVGALMLARLESNAGRSDEILTRSRVALERRFHLEDSQ